MASGCDRPDRLAVPPDPLATLVHVVPETVPLKLALVANAQTPFWNLAQKGLAKFERETGIKVDVHFPAHGRREEQQRIIEDLLARGYHGIMISVIAPEQQLALLDRIATRMNLIMLDADAPLSSRLAFVGPRQYDAGVAAGMAMVRLLPEGGKIAVFAGDLTAENVRQRLRGIRDTILPHNLEIVALKEDKVNRVRARQQVEEVLQSLPELSLMAGLWSYNGPVIREVLKARGQAGRIKVVAFDEEEGTLEGIEDGTIDCSVVLTPFDFSYLGARLLRDLARQGEAALPRDREINTGFLLVNRHNLNELRETLARQNSY